jgi:hypothetical protein
MTYAPLTVRTIVGSHRVAANDSDVVLRFLASGSVELPNDASVDLPIGFQFSVESMGGVVFVKPDSDVVVGGSDRKAVRLYETGVLVKENANFWLLSLGTGGGGGGAVPLPPKITACFGISAGASIVWSAPVDDGGSPITQYIIEQSIDEKEWEGCGVTKPEEISLTVNDLKVGTKYFFRVKAVNANGISDPSNVGEATPTVEFNDASGGVETTYKSGDRYFKVHVFNVTGSLEVKKAPNPFRVLAVAAGANGSTRPGGAGGKVVEAPSLTVPKGVYTATVGATANQPSSLGDLVIASGPGAAGGAGGGDKDRAVNPGQPGTTSTITGTSVVYGGGGGSGGPGSGYQFPGQPGGAGGDGGGGKGGGGGFDRCDGCGPGNFTDGTAGTNGIGGGGGGGGTGEGAKGPYSGGSGIVVVSYEIAPYNDAEGGTTTTYTKDGATFKVHTFTNTGNLIVKQSHRPFRVLVVGGGGGTGSNWGCETCCGDAGGSGSGYHYAGDSDALPVGEYAIAVGNGGSAAGARQVGGGGGTSSFIGEGINRVANGGEGGGQSGSGCCQDRGCRVDGKGGSQISNDITGTAKPYAGSGGPGSNVSPDPGKNGVAGIVIVSYQIG